jgi:hypothetical protein
MDRLGKRRQAAPALISLSQRRRQPSPLPFHSFIHSSTHAHSTFQFHNPSICLLVKSTQLTILYYSVFSDVFIAIRQILTHHEGFSTLRQPDRCPLNKPTHSLQTHCSAMGKLYFSETWVRHVCQSPNKMEENMRHIC